MRRREREEKGEREGQGGKKMEKDRGERRKKERK